jgi:hypothetical protein
MNTPTLNNKVSNKVEATKKKARKVVKGGKFKLLAIILGLVGTLLVLDLACRNITEFTNTHKIIRQPILRIKIQWPYRIESLDTKTATKSSEGLPQVNILPKEQFDERVIDIIAKIRILESNNGLAPSGYHMVCRDKGMVNNVGYGLSEGICFKDEDEEILTLSRWFTKRLKTMDLATAICLYNTGTAQPNCKYYQKFISL